MSTSKADHPLQLEPIPFPVAHPLYWAEPTEDAHKVGD